MSSGSRLSIRLSKNIVLSVDNVVLIFGFDNFVDLFIHFNGLFLLDKSTACSFDKWFSWELYGNSVVWSVLESPCFKKVFVKFVRGSGLKYLSCLPVLVYFHIVWVFINRMKWKSYVMNNNSNIYFNDTLAQHSILLCGRKLQGFLVDL